MRAVDILINTLDKYNINYYAIVEKQLYKYNIGQCNYVIKTFVVYFRVNGKEYHYSISLYANNKVDYIKRLLYKKYHNDIKNWIENLCVDFKI